jgi:hypothetical protein
VALAIPRVGLVPWTRSARPLQLLILTGILAAGCSDTAGPTAAGLVGTYALVSLAQPPAPTLTPPQATGTLVLAKSRYDLTIDLQGQSSLTDAGTYAIAGNTWSQASDDGQTRSTGTYTLSGRTLTLHLTTQGIQSTTVWQQQ